MQIVRIHKFFIIAISALAFFVAARYTIKNPLSLLILISNGVLTIFIWRKIRYPLVLVSGYLILSYLLFTFLTVVNRESTSNFLYSANEMVIPNLAITIIFLTLPFYFIYRFYVEKVGLAIDEEKQNYKTKSHPYLICKEHYTRTSTTVIGEDYVRVRCRTGKNCAKEKKLTYAKRIIGIVGKPVIRNYYRGNYYVAMWDAENKQVINGDYDIIEIHNNPEISDFDSIMNKIIALFYNDVDRYIPIYQVNLKIIGSPVFSASTQRLIDKSFTNIEYL
jgi:hypothetical protein